ncbi:phosphatase PAP2 family protein [Neogemmobacter tilapiae]|uniref:Phosphoesterase n=1 Tax=Neogemmobacter tilapiae TaxID=875041 RepID=A0A918WHJ0_9RHOB|nr:phosphatase PAP2 family protein [Gemmobacter tilapiae]GHC52135.1 phosphoesterase [Gemmobacter tilapiae]
MLPNFFPDALGGARSGPALSSLYRVEIYKPADLSAVHWTARILATILLCFALFAIWPEIDLRFSGLFYDPSAGFLIEGHPLTEALRLAVWNLGILLCLAAAICIVLGAAGYNVVLSIRAWGFILLLYGLAPGLMVEMLTKPIWGRARPAQITEFGGNLPFSPPNEMVDFCTRNCTFVSGEVSGATVTGLALLLLLFHLKPRLHKILWFLLLTTALCLPVAIALQRIAAGRHFLSDSLFAVLFTLLMALGLVRFLRCLPHPMRWLRPRQDALATALGHVAKTGQE